MVLEPEEKQKGGEESLPAEEVRAEEN